MRANFVGAAVSLDGTRVGVTGASPVVISDVSPGKHEVSVEKSGYTTTKQEFTLAAGQSLPLTLDLSPVSVEVPRPQGDAEARTGRSCKWEPARQGEAEAAASNVASGARAGFWVAVVGTAASAGLAVKYGLDVRDINQQLDQYRRFTCSTSPTGVCDSHGNAAQPLTSAQKSSVTTLTDKGNKDADPAVGLCGCRRSLRGGRRIPPVQGLPGGRRQPRRGQSASNHGLRIFPTATASARGIAAEFDF